MGRLYGNCESNNETLNKIMDQTFCNLSKAKCWFGCGDIDKIVEGTIANKIMKRLKYEYIHLKDGETLYRTMIINILYIFICPKINVSGMCTKISFGSDDNKVVGIEEVTRVMEFHLQLGDDYKCTLTTKYGGTI